MKEIQTDREKDKVSMKDKNQWDTNEAEEGPSMRPSVASQSSMNTSRNLFARKGDVESRKSGHKREYLNNSRADAELAQKIAKMHHTLMPTNFCPK